MAFKRKKENKKERSSLLIFMVCLVAAMITYTGALLLQRNILEQAKEPVTEVYTAVKDMERNTFLDDGNFDSYFKLEGRPNSSLPENHITAKDRSVLIGTYAARDYAAKDIVTTKGFSAAVSVKNEIEAPIEISFGVPDLAQAVGGTIRQGDRINIYAVREVPGETGDTSLSTEQREKSYQCMEIYTNAFVTGAYTAAGDAIAADADPETDAPTTVISVLIPMAAEQEFDLALESGTIRVSRVCS